MASSASLPLLTEAELEDYLNLGSGDDNTRIAAMVAAASQAVEVYCARSFKLQKYTEYYDGEVDTPDGVILVANPPVANSSGVLVNTQAQIDASGLTVHVDSDLAWGDDTAIDLDDLYVDPEMGAIVVPGGLAAGNHNVKVVYYGGLAEETDDLPDDLRMAACIVAANLYNRSRSRADGIRSESEAGASTTYSGEDVPETARQLLAGYVREEL